MKMLERWDAVVSACRGFCSVLGPLQSVQALVCLLIFLASIGSPVGGDIWMTFGVMVGRVRLVEDFALFLGLFRLFRGLSYGVLFLLCRLMMGFILGLTLFELYGMFAAFWVARLLLVLLSRLDAPSSGAGHGSDL